MIKAKREKLIAELLDTGIAGDEDELLSMLEDMGTTLDDIENGDWY